MSEVTESSSSRKVFAHPLSSESESNPVSEVARKSISSRAMAELDSGRVNEDPPMGSRVTTAHTSAVVHTKGLAATATAKMPPEPVEFKKGLSATPSAKPQMEPKERDKLMASGKAKLVFSTHAMSGKGTSREVELTKEEDKKQVEDTDRQDKVDQQFMDIKHELGLGEHETKDAGGTVAKYDKKMVNYSITWHFIEIFNEDGTLDKRVDLLDKGALKALLKERGRDDSDTNVEKVYNKLLGINREVKKLTEKEVGKEKRPAFMSDHHYIGNPNGPALFHPRTEESRKVLEDKKHGKYHRSMERLELAERDPKPFLGKGELRLTAKGAEAVNDMRKSSQFQILLKAQLAERAGKLEKKISGLKDEIADGEPESDELKGARAELAEVRKLYGEIYQANRTAMNMTLMDLHGNHQVKERGSSGIEQKSVDGADLFRDKEGIYTTKAKQRVESLVSEMNPKGIVSKENYKPQNGDKKVATEIALLANHLKKDTNRLDNIEVSQDIGRTVYRDPQAEAFILYAVLNPGTNDLRSYEGLQSSEVKKLLRSTLAEFHSTVPQMVPKKEGDSASEALRKVSFGEEQVESNQINKKVLWKPSSSSRESAE